MIKELEALENIKHYDTRVGLHEDDYNIIKTALKRLESIEDTRFIILGGRCSGKTQKINALLKLKAFEIIKEKDVDIGWLKRAKDLHEYNSGIGINSYGALTEQEYNLLKEALL